MERPLEFMNPKYIIPFDYPSEKTKKYLMNYKERVLNLYPEAFTVDELTDGNVFVIENKEKLGNDINFNVDVLGIGKTEEEAWENAWEDAYNSLYADAAAEDSFKGI